MAPIKSKASWSTNILQDFGSEAIQISAQRSVLILRNVFWDFDLHLS